VWESIGGFKMDSKKIEYVKISKTELERLQRLTKKAIEKTIKQAMEYHWLIEVNYQNEGVRIVKPHAYFWNENTLKNYLNCFQMGGFTESGKLFSWKTFAIEKITDCNIKIPIVEFTLETSFNPEWKGYGNTNLIVTESGFKQTDNS
jgi:hypothetical protein